MLGKEKMKDIIHKKCGKRIENCGCTNPEVSIVPKEWSWWTHRKYAIVMEVTKVWRGKVNLWDKPMLFRWTGTIQQFKKAWQPGFTTFRK